MVNLLNNQTLQQFLHKAYQLSKPFIIPALILAFILGDAYVIAYKKLYIYPYNALPLILFVLYQAIFHLQNLVYLLAFCTPLAVSLKEMGLTQGPDLSIPTEPIMAGIMLIYILNSLNKPLTDVKFRNHPISYLIYFQLTWIFITCLTSTEIAISFKALTARLWFIFSCYIIMPYLFKSKKNIINFIMAYAIALSIVVAYTLVIHSQFNFNDKAADWVVSPFYNDHTAYGAALAMFIPLMVALLCLPTLSKFLKIIVTGLLLWFLLGIVLSFARAGWLSLVVALGVLFTLLLRIKFGTIILTIVTVTVIFFTFQTEILIALGKNSSDSEGGFENNIESVSNISTDASNRERLNRWSCAIRMWEDKPVFGWGPGTYMFKYAPYQLSHQLTIISTNFGTNGNAHSEYLGPLAEEGLPGMLIMIVILFYTTHLGYKLVYTLADKEDRILFIGIFLSIMTYFVHGFFNNFLDTDKLSLPFWAFMAALVCFDLYYPKKKAITNSN